METLSICLNNTIYVLNRYSSINWRGRSIKFYVGCDCTESMNFKTEGEAKATFEDILQIMDTKNL